MKKWTSTLIISCAVLLVGFTYAVLPIGSPLPLADLKMQDISGKDISMKMAAQENGLLVMFSANGCQYVLENEQRTVAICEYALKNKIGVILINSNEAQRDKEDSYEAMKAYATGLHYSWPYVIDKDNKVADAFDARRTPEIFLFDKNLNLSYHGAIDDNPVNELAVTRQHLREAINEMVAGKNITVKETRGVGCIIMRNKKKN